MVRVEGVQKEMTTTISQLLNIAAVCFFIGEILSVIRVYRAKDVMNSTSLEGKLVHLLGNILMIIISLLTGAYIAVVTETILVIISLTRIYYKLLWMLKNDKWSWFG